MGTGSWLLSALQLLFVSLNVLFSGVEAGKTTIGEWQQQKNTNWHGTQPTLNCSSYVPLKEQQWLQAHPPPFARENDSNSTKADDPVLTIPMDYLHKCLLKIDYDLTVPPFELIVRPRINYSFGVCEVHELSFSGSLKVESSFYFTWHDHRRMYDENVSFDGDSGWRFPKHIEMPPDELWTPTFRLVNCESKDCFIDATNNSLAILHSNGTVELWLHKSLVATCQLILTNFPFDEQNCSLIFIMGYLHRIEDFKLNRLELIMLDYTQENEEWVVESFTHAPECMRNNILRPISGDRKQGLWNRSNANGKCDQLIINATLKIARHPDYYICYIIVPTLVITIADLLTVFVPMEAKLELSVTLLLAFTFLQALVASSTPKAREIPLLGMYILFALILSGVNLIIVVLTIAINNYGEEHSRPPLWLRVVGIRIWRWPLMEARRIASNLRKSLRDQLSKHRNSPSLTLPPVANEHLAVEAESHENRDELVASFEPTTKAAANNSSPVSCDVDQLDESWKVLARYLEMLASAVFVAMQVYIFFKFLYPLLTLWAGHEQHKSYFEHDLS